MTTEEGVKLSPEAIACLRTMVAWCIVGHPSLKTDHLDRVFGRRVWEEVSGAGLMDSAMYGDYLLKPEAVFVAMGWS